MNITAILNVDGTPLNPTFKSSLIRQLLKNKEAEVVSKSPIFVIKLLTNSTRRTKYIIHTQEKQNLTLGIDMGYKHVGFSLISDTHELISGTLELRTDISKLLTSKKMYRTQRKRNKRFRQARFDHRRIKAGWFAPSIEHKINSAKKLISVFVSYFPLQNIICETGKFDIQKLKNPDITNQGYQQGERYNIDSNLTSYILQRDSYQCKHKECKHKNDKVVLYVHHLIHRTDGGTDSPNNLITLCQYCHTPANHKNGYLDPKRILGNTKLSKDFKDATFMNIVRKEFMKRLNEQFAFITIKETFGYITKNKRLSASDAGLEGTEKSHNNDAFFIAEGYFQKRTDNIWNIKIERRNNRSLETFRDAKYYDIRDGEIKNGQELSSGRTTRSKANYVENLRKFRRPIMVKNKKGQLVRKEITKGNRSIRSQRYEIQKGTIIRLNEDYKHLRKGEILTSAGLQNKGSYSYLMNENGLIKDKDNKKIIIPTRLVSVVRHNKGLIWSKVNKEEAFNKIEKDEAVLV